MKKVKYLGKSGVKISRFGRLEYGDEILMTEHEYATAVQREDMAKRWSLVAGYVSKYTPQDIAGMQPYELESFGNLMVKAGVDMYFNARLDEKAMRDTFVANLDAYNKILEEQAKAEQVKEDLPKSVKPSVKKAAKKAAKNVNLG